MKQELNRAAVLTISKCYVDYKGRKLYRKKLIEDEE